MQSLSGSYLTHEAALISDSVALSQAALVLFIVLSFLYYSFLFLNFLFAARTTDPKNKHNMCQQHRPMVQTTLDMR